MTEQHDVIPAEEPMTDNAVEPGDDEAPNSSDEGAETQAAAAEPEGDETVADQGDEAATADSASADDAAETSEAPDDTAATGKPNAKVATVVAPPEPKAERPEVIELRKAQESKEPVEGKIIGWNNGGLHVVVKGITAFCPRSEIEIGAPKGPEAYLDKTLPFVVLRVQKRGRRIVLSRRALLQGDRDEKLDELRAAMKSGEVLEGKVSSITDFGAFVDLGGIDGLIHVSEISRTRINHASEALSEGDEVKVRVLRISDDGSRVSLSAKALEPDPWDGIEDRFPPGEMVTGTVERTAEFGAFIEIAPGLTGLLPTSAMNLPRNASPARAYQPGKEVSVQVLSIDRRRQRISLALEGSQAEGTKADLKSFRERQSKAESSFGALAAAFEKARTKE